MGPLMSGLGQWFRQRLRSRGGGGRDYLCALIKHNDMQLQTACSVLRPVEIESGGMRAALGLIR